MPKGKDKAESYFISSNLPPPRSDVEETDVQLHLHFDAALRRLNLHTLARNRTGRECGKYLVLSRTVERNDDVRKLIGGELDHNTLDIVDVVEPFGDGNLDTALVFDNEILLCHFVFLL